MLGGHATPMSMIVDYFFSPYIPPQEKRRRASLRAGLAHVAEIAPRDPVPGEPVVLTFWSNMRYPIDRVAVTYTTDGTEPASIVPGDDRRGDGSPASTLPPGERGTVVLTQPAEARRDPATGFTIRAWRATLPGQPEGTLVRYRAEGWSLRAAQSHWYADAVDPVSANPPHGRLFAYHVDARRPPDWFRDAIIYHIFVDRFATAADELPLHDPGTLTDYFGGTLRGITARLDYIAALGATMIWLSPVFESPTYHGYNPSSYEVVSAHYGGNAALHELIAAAHARGLRVMLDFVANHTSDEHPAFREALADPTGPAGRWYFIDGTPPYGYHAYAHVKDMPELNTEEPEVRRYLSDAARSWLKELGADALRLDFVSGPSHAFWTEFQEAIKEANPAAVTLGEITAVQHEVPVYAGRLDAYMDFPLCKLLRQTFAQRAMPLATFLNTILDRQPGLSPEMLRASLLDNHDMHRFLWLAENDTARLRLAAVCQLTLDGTPAIYYGTEVGVTQRAGPYGQDSYAREPMRWGAEQDADLLAWYRELIALRRAHVALRRGTLGPLELIVVAGQRDQVGGYRRQTAEETIAILLNNAEEAAHVRLPLSAIQARSSGQSMRNLLMLADRCEIVVQGDVWVGEIPPFGVAVLGG